MRFLRESAVEQVLDGHDDAARDQQGDVRRMSRSSLPRWLASPPPSVAVEITARRVTAVGARRPRRQLRVVGATRPSRCAPGVVDAGAERAERPRSRRRWRRPSARRARQLVGSRPRRVALVLPDSVAKVSLLRFEKVPAKPQDLDQLIRWQMRKAAPFQIEDAQVSWAPARRPARAAAASISSRVARRDIIESYERACEAAGAHAGLVDLASFNLINAVLAGEPAPPATGCWCTSPPDYATLAVVRDGCVDLLPQPRAPSGDRRSAGSRAPDGDVSRGSAGRRRVRAVVLAGASVRGAGRRRAVPRGCSRSASGMRVEPLDFRPAAEMRDRIAPAPSCWTCSRRRSACCCATASRAAVRGRVRRSRWPSAAHQPLDPPVLQRARRPRCCSRWRRCSSSLLTAFNAIRIVSLSRQNTELSSLVNRDRDGGAAPDARGGSASAPASTRRSSQAVADAAEEANALIDQRTFSWTEFFNQHRGDAAARRDADVGAADRSRTDVTTIQMSVLGRRSEDIDEFMEKLEATGAFDDVLPTQQDTTDEGLHRADAAKHLHRDVGRRSAAAAEPANAAGAGSSRPPARRDPATPPAESGAGSARDPAARATRRRRTMIDVRRIVSREAPRRLPIVGRADRQRRAVCARRVSAVAAGRERRAAGRRRARARSSPRSKIYDVGARRP